jgi:flavorubredoxin
MIQTLNLNAPAPPEPMMTYLDADAVLFSAYRYLQDRYPYTEDAALAVIERAHRYLSDAILAAYIRGDYER